MVAVEAGPVLVVVLVSVVVEEVTNPPLLSATTPTARAPKDKTRTTSERILLLKLHPASYGSSEFGTSSNYRTSLSIRQFLLPVSCIDLHNRRKKIENSAITDFGDKKPFLLCRADRFSIVRTRSLSLAIPELTMHSRSP